MTARKAPAKRRSGRRSPRLRNISGALALLFALVAMGVAYATVAPRPSTASADTADEALIAKGKELYANSCITCHGSNLQGVQDRGPSLIGVGEAAAYFQMSTGRMPADADGAQMPRKRPFFTEEQITAIAAYVQSNGGGPIIPGTNDGDLQDVKNLALGGELYRLNCASCHNYTGEGGALSQGKYAPNLEDATDRQIFGAMLSGPENMPKFGDGQLTPDEKKAIVAFIQNNKTTVDPGGYALGGFGPAPEGLVAFLVGMGAIVALTLWLGSRA